MNLRGELDQARRTRVAIEELIAAPALLGPDLQPIRRMADGGLVGHKAVGRGRPGTEIGDTLSLLAGAQSLGLVERLDWAFRCHTFDVALSTPDLGELHLTPEPETFGSPCPPRLSESWHRGRRALSLVAELHDDAFADLPRLSRALEEMRGWGWRFAVGDLSPYRSLWDAVAQVGPTYVEVDLADPSRAALAEVADWLAVGQAAGATVLAVGVDSAAAHEAASRVGAQLFRGTVAAAG
jgi:EAL domain-containing protein (putative c-di-GMP-specific phosphodiesterase class I)